MKKFIDYILKNIRNFCVVGLMSIFFVFLLFPVLINLECIKKFLNIDIWGPFIAVTALVFIFIIYSWGEAQDLWQRCKNTYELKKPPCIYPFVIIFFIVFSALLIFIFQKKYIPDSSSKFNIFAGINIISILFGGVFILVCKKKERTPEVTPVDNYSLIDEPIKSTEQDLLGREDFIENLYQNIIKLEFEDSFVFGLNGKWGEGKTSVLNLLRDKIEEKDDFLVVNFNPWYFGNEKAVLTAFYKQIEQTLSKKFIFPNLEETFTKYHNLISLGVSQAGIKMDFSHMEESIEETQQRIQSYIDQTEKKIIIFIDDIDRLQAKEILLVFKLIRLNVKFKNTIFILSFDPVIIQNLLNVASEFLEKIVQKPISLPAVEQRALVQFLDIHLDGSIYRKSFTDIILKYSNENWMDIFVDPKEKVLKFKVGITEKDFDFITDKKKKTKVVGFWKTSKNNFFDVIGISQEDKERFYKEFNSIYQTQIGKLFKTLRQVKRFLNGIYSTLSPIKSEVNLSDFFILEVIRNFYPNVYNDIWQKPWFYIHLDGSNSDYFVSPLISLTDEERYSEIKTHIEDIVKNEKEEKILEELLKTIFFVEVGNAFREYRATYGNDILKQRITNPKYFRNYFMLKVPSLEISDEYMKTTLKLWHSAEKTERENIIEKSIFYMKNKEKLPDFFNKLILSMDKIQEEIVPDIVRVIYKNVDKFHRKGIGGSLSDGGDRSESFLLHLINKKTDKNERQAILKEVITNISDFPFAVDIVYSCKTEKTYSSVEIRQMQDIVANRLKKYFVDGKKDIFEELPEERDWVFVLYQWATNWKMFTGDNNETVNNYVFSLIKDDAKKFIKFISYYTKKNSSLGFIFKSEELNLIYNLAEFQKLAEKFKEDNSLSSEEKIVIEIFLKQCEDKKNKDGKKQ